MITLYGNRRSRATRCLWALEELQLTYNHIAIDHLAGETKAPDYLRLNPSGKVPTLVDGKLVMFESVAINLYLAQTYGRAPMWPADQNQRAHTLQWSFWAVAEAEPPIVTLAMERVFKPEPARDPDLASAAERDLTGRLALIEAGLADGTPHLIDPAFTIADLNIASILGSVRMVGFDLSPWPALNAWLERCLSRPAYQKAMGR